MLGHCTVIINYSRTRRPCSCCTRACTYLCFPLGPWLRLLLLLACVSLLCVLLLVLVALMLALLARCFALLFAFCRSVAEYGDNLAAAVAAPATEATPASPSAVTCSSNSTRRCSRSSSFFRAYIGVH